MINQPQRTNGVPIKTNFLLPSHPDNIPPIGEQKIPTIQKIEANQELSFSSNISSIFVSFFNCGNAIVVKPSRALRLKLLKEITNAPNI